MKRVLPFLFCIGLFLEPHLARADEPEPLHRFEDKSYPRVGTQSTLLLAGAAVTAAFYLPALGSSYLWSDHRGASEMRYPLVGPWMAVAKTSLCGASFRDPNIACSDFVQVAGAMLLVLDGLGQAGGVGLMVESFFMPKRASSLATGRANVGRRNLLPRAAWSSRPKKARFLSVSSGDFEVHPVPMSRGRADLGLAFVGSF